MIRKPYPRSFFPARTDAERKMLEGWLCDENISYNLLKSRCKKKFGEAPSHGAIHYFFRKVQQKRNLAEILRSAQQANAVVKKLGNNPAETAKAIMTVAGQIAFNTAVLNANGKKLDLDALSKTMDVYLSTRKDDREAGKFALDREKWEFDVARLCFEHHQELQKISEDTSLDEDARLLAIRKRLFGPNLPG